MQRSGERRSFSEPESLPNNRLQLPVTRLTLQTASNISAQSASTARHLTPCSSHMAEFVIQAEYIDRVRSTLKIGLENDPASLPRQHLLARVVATPGWRDSEWVVSVYLNEEGDSTVEVVEAETSIWIANSGGEGGRVLKRHPVPVAANRSLADLSEDLAQEIGAVWNAALLNVRPQQHQPLLLDAPTYTFVRDTIDDAGLCGESKAGIAADPLLEIAELLRRYVKAGEEDKADILRSIHELAI